MTNTLVFISGFLFFLIAYAVKGIVPKPILNISKQESAANFDEGFIQYSSLGNKMMLADLIWIQTLLEADLEHYKKDDLNSWIYHRFNSILNLDPKFYEAYLFGSRYLLIIKDDIEGGKDLLVRSREYYPDDYGLNFSLGYLYAIELGEADKALPHFIKIKNDPRAPMNIESLISKAMASKFGPQEAFDYTLPIYQEMSEENPLKRKLYLNLYALKAEVDLECLNLKKSGCDESDFDGNNYFFDGKLYRAQKKWHKSRIKKREQ